MAEVRGTPVAALQTLGGCEASFVTIDSDDEGMCVDDLATAVRKRRHECHRAREAALAE